MNGYNCWDYDPETRKVYDLEAEHGLVLADIYPYDDADDIGRLMAAAPEMYRLLKVWTQIGAEPTLKNARKRAVELLDSIDGEETKDECD